MFRLVAAKHDVCCRNDDVAEVHPTDRRRTDDDDKTHRNAEVGVATNRQNIRTTFPNNMTHRTKQNEILEMAVS